MIRSPRILVLAATAALTILSAGCATTSGAGGTRKTAMPKAVEDRAVKRWELLIAHKAEEAYNYLTPGFRQTKTRDQYALEMNNRPVAWKTVHLLDKKCEEDTCNLRFEIEFSVRMGAAMTGPVSSFSMIEERWLKIDGKWFYLPQNPAKAAGSKGLR